MKTQLMQRYMALKRKNWLMSIFPLLFSLFPILVSAKYEGFASHLLLSIGLIVAALGYISIDLWLMHKFNLAKAGFTIEDMEYMEKNFWKKNG